MLKYQKEYFSIIWLCKSAMEWLHSPRVKVRKTDFFFKKTPLIYYSQNLLFLFSILFLKAFLLKLFLNLLCT